MANGRYRVVLATAVLLARTMVTLGAVSSDPNASVFKRLFPQSSGRVASGAKTGAQRDRVLHFPDNRPLGKILIRDADATLDIQSFYYWIRTGGTWRHLSTAEGEVTIPAGKVAQFSVDPDRWQDLSVLESLDPDGLYSLGVSGPMPGSIVSIDEIMSHIAHLEQFNLLCSYIHMN